MSDGHRTEKIESVLHRSLSDYQPSVQGEEGVGFGWTERASALWRE